MVKRLPVRRRRRSRPRLITICRGPIIPLTCSFKFKFSALIPKAHDRAQLKSLTSTHKAPCTDSLILPAQPSLAPMPKARDRAQLKSSSKLKVPCTDSRESPIVRGALCGIGGARSKTPYRCGLPVLKRRSSTIALFPERCDE